MPAAVAFAAEPHDLPTAIAALPENVRALLDSPRIRVVEWDDPAVPPDIRAQARLGERKRKPSVCLHDDEAGTFLLVIGEIDHVGHELIHVAQALADDAALDASLAQVAEDGRRLVKAARAAVRGGCEADAHRDLAWCRKAVHPRNDTPPRRGQQDVGLIATFDLHHAVHPVAATRALGASLGLDESATMAASFAYYFVANGCQRPRSDPARECVAYRFQDDLAALAPLFDNAVRHLTSRPQEAP